MSGNPPLPLPFASTVLAPHMWKGLKAASIIQTDADKFKEVGSESYDKPSLVFTRNAFKQFNELQDTSCKIIESVQNEGMVKIWKDWHAKIVKVSSTSL